MRDATVAMSFQVNIEASKSANSHLSRLILLFELVEMAYECHIVYPLNLLQTTLWIKNKLPDVESLESLLVWGKKSPKSESVEYFYFDDWHLFLYPQLFWTEAVDLYFYIGFIFHIGGKNLSLDASSAAP